MTTRFERLFDIFWLDSESDPTSENQVNRNGGQLLAYFGGRARKFFSDVANQFSGLDDRAIPDDDDLLLLENVSTGEKQKIRVVNLPGGGGGISADQHKILRQLIHFIDDGPAEGFTSGAYKEITGTVTPSAIVWYESSSKLKKIVERLVTWSGIVPSVDKWKIYDNSGITVIWTVSDAISYTGIFETDRTRTITLGDA